MVKRRFFLALMAVLLVFSVAIPVYSAEMYSMYIEKSTVVLPDVNTYAYILDANGNPVENLPRSAFKMALDGMDLTVDDVVSQRTSAYGTTFYYLLDISGSVPQSTFSIVKNAVADKILNKPDKDRIVVITFGSSVNVITDGTEDPASAAEAVRALAASDDYTLLYDALSTVTRLAGSVEDEMLDRSVVFLVTDGEDVNKGGTTENAVTASLSNAGIPVFSFGFSNSRDEYLSMLSDFAYDSGGRSCVIDAGNAVAGIAAMSDYVNNAYRISAHSDTNIVSKSSAKLTLKADVGNAQLTADKEISITNWKRDNTCPEVTGAEILDAYHIEVRYSEPVKGADSPTNYSVSYIDKGNRILGIAVKALDRNTAISITKASYSDDKMTAILTSGNVLYDGEYVVEVSGVADISMEENKTSASVRVSCSDNAKKDLHYWFEYQLPTTVVFIGIIIVLMIAVVIAVSKLAGKNGKNRSEEGSASSSEIGDVEHGDVYIHASNNIRAEFTIVDPDKIEHRVTAPVGNSYIVGRSKERCDLGIDDARMSRVHFELSANEGQLFIRDLESRNGTYLNGVRIQSLRPVQNGDCITAANTRITVRIDDRG